MKFVLLSILFIEESPLTGLSRDLYGWWWLSKVFGETDC